MKANEITIDDKLYNALIPTYMPDTMYHIISEVKPPTIELNC